MGFTLCMHLFLVVRHFSFQQPDIIRSGRVLSAVTVIAMMTLTFDLVLVVIVDGWKGIPQAAGQIATATLGFWLPWTDRPGEIFNGLF